MPGSHGSMTLVPSARIPTEQWTTEGGVLRRRRARHHHMVTTGRSDDEPGALRVLRISKSGVVTAWRERERRLRARGADLTLVTAVRWEEGGSSVPFTADGDDFVVPVRTVGHHPNLFVYDPLGLWRVLGSARWDLIDMHEEPFGLAVAEVLLLCRLRSLRIPFVVSSAQNIEKRYPPPFRWLERWSLRRAAGAYTCNVEAGGILRRKGLAEEPVLLPLGVDVRPVPGGGPSAPGRASPGGLRGSAHPSQGSRRAAGGGGRRRPDERRDLRGRARGRPPGRRGDQARARPTG